MPPGSVRRATSVLRVLRNRPLRHLWVSDLVSDAGSFVTFIALAVYIHTLTGGVAAVGFALGLRSIAGFLFGPFTGVIADRLDRRRVMVVCNLGRAVLVSALAFTHAAWEAYLLAFGSAVLAPLYRSARAALLPRIAPAADLVPALTVVDTTHHLLHMVGPAFGGLVVLAVGARLGFIVDAATFLISAAFLTRIPRTGRAEPSGRSPVRDFADGVAALVRAPAVRTYSLINAVLAFSGAGIVALLVVYVRDDLGRSGGAFGLVLAVAGLATVATSVVIAVRDEHHARTPWVFVAALAGGSFLLMLLRPSFPILLLMGAGLGLQDGGIDIPSSATSAETLADRFRGRAAAASEGFGDLCFAVGSIGFALLGDPSRLGVPGAMALAGGLGVVLPLAILAAGGAAAIARSERRRLAGNSS